MKIEKTIRKVEKMVKVEEPVYILEMSELDALRIKELVGSIGYEDFNEFVASAGVDEEVFLKDGSWLWHFYHHLKTALKQ